MRYCIIWHNKIVTSITPAFRGIRNQLNFVDVRTYTKKDIEFFNSRKAAEQESEERYTDIITEEEADFLLVELKLKYI